MSKPTRWIRNLAAAGGLLLPAACNGTEPQPAAPRVSTPNPIPNPVPNPIPLSDPNPNPNPIPVSDPIPNPNPAPAPAPISDPNPIPNPIPPFEDPCPPCGRG